MSRTSDKSFPVITHIDEFQKHFEGSPEFRFFERPHNTVLGCYGIMGRRKFETSLERECRGIIFDKKSGGILSRPLHKFENYPGTHEEFLNFLLSECKYGMVKLDGTMVRSFLCDDQLIFATKHEYDGEILDEMRRVMERMYPRLPDICRDLYKRGFTPIFEYRSPTFPHVIPVTRKTITLIALRHHINGYYRHDLPLDIKFAAAEGHIDITARFSGREIHDVIVDHPDYIKEIEGFVVVDHDGNFWKWKTDSYTGIASLLGRLCPQVVAEMVVTETLDDVEHHLYQAGVDRHTLYNVKHTAAAALSQWNTYITEEVEKYKNASLDVAAKRLDPRYRKVILRKLRGMSVDLTQEFIRLQIPILFSRDRIPCRMISDT